MNSTRPGYENKVVRLFNGSSGLNPQIHSQWAYLLNRDLQTTAREDILSIMKKIIYLRKIC